MSSTQADLWHSELDKKNLDVDLWMKIQERRNWRTFAMSLSISSGRCMGLMVHWRAIGTKMNHHWFVLSCLVNVYILHGTILTAMADLTPWSWKKTFPPSSGHTVLISSLVIPSSWWPFSTPRLDAVLLNKNNKTQLYGLIIKYVTNLLNKHLWSPSSPCGSCHSHFGETFVIQPGFDLWRCGAHVQSHWATTSVSLWGGGKGRKCHLWNLLNTSLSKATVCVT